MTRSSRPATERSCSPTGPGKALWTAIAAPGALLVDGEVAGTWRAKAARRRLDITVGPFDRLDPALTPRLEAEARLVADARGLPDVRVLLET